MQYNFNMTIGQLLDDPKSRKIFQRNVPQLLNHPMLNLARNFQLKDLERYSNKANISPATIAKIKQELQELNK